MSLYTGHFSRPQYDKCAYPEDLYESTAPFQYITSTDRIYNCNGCMTGFGPRGSYMGVGANTVSGNTIAEAQQNIDIDSIMSNRNVPLSRCKRGKVNPINTSRIKTKSQLQCNDYLDAQHTKMSDPAMFYRGVAINRFHDLNRDPQANIFYDWAVNTSLEAKDNFIPDLPDLLTEVDMVPDMPAGVTARPRDPSWQPCAIELKGNGNCGTGCSYSTRTRTARSNNLNRTQYR
jgi:hypothetical protein